MSQSATYFQVGAYLTLKSIPALLSELETDGKIVRFVPRSRKAPQRRLYFSADAERTRLDPYSAVNVLCGKGFVDAAITHWTRNGHLYLDDRGKPRFLK